MKKRALPVFVINHQDLTWRRCFDRPLSFNGEDYVSYAHLQKLYILENIRLCEKYPEFRFSIECVATLRHFLMPVTHTGFPHGSVGEESACSVGDLGSIPGL